MKFQKGNQLGNRKGRPRAPEIEKLRQAIAEVEQEKGKSLLKHFVEQAFKDKRVLIALAKKIVPDLSAMDGKVLVDAADEFKTYLRAISSEGTGIQQIKE